MRYQINYGDGYENVTPDGYGIHLEWCKDEKCEGCWNPSSNNYEPWFEEVKEQGSAVSARVLFGGQELEERFF